MLDRTRFGDDLRPGDGPPPRTALLPRRVFDVTPNELRITGSFRDVLTAHLGAGVAICLYDAISRRGGMAVVLPAGGCDGRAVSLMKALIDDLAPSHGSRARLEAHVFGGAALPVAGTDPCLGARASSFALRFLGEAGVSVKASDLGGCFPRQVRFEPAAARLAAEFVSLRGAEELARREQVLAAAPHCAG